MKELLCNLISIRNDCIFSPFLANGLIASWTSPMRNLNHDYQKELNHLHWIGRYGLISSPKTFVRPLTSHKISSMSCSVMVSTDFTCRGVEDKWLTLQRAFVWSLGTTKRKCPSPPITLPHVLSEDDGSFSEWCVHAAIITAPAKWSWCCDRSHFWIRLFKPSATICISHSSSFPSDRLIKTLLFSSSFEDLTAQFRWISIDGGTYLRRIWRNLKPYQLDQIFNFMQSQYKLHHSIEHKKLNITV